MPWNGWSARGSRMRHLWEAFEAGSVCRVMGRIWREGNEGTVAAMAVARQGMREEWQQCQLQDREWGKSGGGEMREDFEGTSNSRVSGVFASPSLTSIFTSFLDHLRQLSPTLTFDRTLYQEF
jgi:hypothetical protein